MINPPQYLELYDQVHSAEVAKYIVRKKEIKLALKCMVEDNPSHRDEKFEHINYDDPAYRCAYLFKYAPLHACLVQDMFINALTESAAIVNPNFWKNNNCINICSIGGGPGIDIISVLSALHWKYGPLRYSASIIESVLGWKDTFDTVLAECLFGTVLKEFQNKKYGLSMNLTPEYFQYSYMVTDLLGIMDFNADKAIGSADLITMVKCRSDAGTCVDTVSMIRKVFNSMRHGSVVFIIDNASGGYGELVSLIAQECRMVPVFGPLHCFNYNNPNLNKKKYKSRTCFDIQVTVHFLMKPYKMAHEMNFSLKSDLTNFKKKNDYCNLSNEDSAVSFETSGLGSDYSKLDSKTFIPNFVKQDKLNVAHDMRYYSNNRELSATSGSNFVQSNKFEPDRSIQNSSKCFGGLEIKSLCKDSSSEPLVCQAPNLATNLDFSVPEAPDRTIVNSSNSLQRYGNLESKSFSKDSNCESDICQTPALATKSDLLVSEAPNRSIENFLKCYGNLDMKSFCKEFLCQMPTLAPHSNVSVSETPDQNKVNSSCSSKIYSNLRTKSINKDSNWESDLRQLLTLANKSNISATETFDKTIKNSSKFNCNLETKSFYKDSSYEPLFNQRPSLANELNLLVSEIRDRSIGNSSESSKRCGKLESESFDKDSNCKPILGPTPALTKSNLSLSTIYEINSDYDNPLYKLFPPNNEEQRKYFETLISASIEDTEVENNKELITPLSQIDSEKILCQKNSITLTKSVDDFEIKTLQHNTENILTENIPVKQVCVSCSKLKRIDWLQKLCTICNPKTFDVS